MKQLDQPNAKHPDITSHRAILVALALSALLPSMAISSVNLTLPILAAQLAVSFSQVQWLTIAYMLSLTSTLIIAGKLIDIKGQKLVFVTGLLIFSGASIALGLTKSIYLLTFSRAVQGVGGAMLVVVNMVIASKVFEKRNEGMVIGLIGSMSALGTGAGPVLASFLIECCQWQSVFLINIPIAAVILLCAFHSLPANKIELRQAKQPLFHTSTLNKPALKVSLIANFLISNVVMISLIIGPFYLTLALQLSIVEVGFVMVASPVTVAVFAFLSGKLSSIANLDKLVLIGVTVISLGAVWMTQISVEDGVTGYIIGLVIIGSGYATFTSANNTQVMLNVDADNQGLLSSTLSLSKNLGLMVGATLSSSLFSCITGLSQQMGASPKQLVNGVNLIYYGALFVLLGLLSLQFIHKFTSKKKHIETL
ncbi:MFS transporter [Pseudoalteromonas sp. MMG022]|uniref:MFS transporter n=1 Tax=Pseudoalteromonas sp. MMG022 TaxID=2909978 RepID=UPI001F4743BD|nr:MFS transporter [Pseudoalteromonas sp. MMG022]MCF6437216.1 MFS transporter [Pseudoalteromonas sp. MMG022]